MQMHVFMTNQCFQNCVHKGCSGTGQNAQWVHTRAVSDLVTVSKLAENWGVPAYY